MYRIGTHARKYLCLWLCALIFAVVAGGEALAQTISGSITGTVVDSTGAVVPGVAVTLMNEATAVTRTSETNDSGVFVFDAVLVGKYTVRGEKTGFKRFERTGLELSSQQRLAVGNIELVVGEVSDTLTVAAQAEQVSTESSERSGLLDEKQLDLLIVRGLDPVNLVKVLPGVSQVASFGSENREDNLVTGNLSLGGQFGTFTPNIQGVRTYFNNFSLDGQPGGDADIEGVFNEVSSMDSIGEAKAVLNNYAAEYGRNPGAIVNFVTKSGTQDYHGNVYYFKRHEQLNANEFFNNKFGIPKRVYRFNTFGFTGGGPIFIPNKFNTKKDKLFFFWAQENWQITQPEGAQLVTTPTAQERNGDFSQTLDQNGQLIPIIDPTTGSQFPGNIIPGNRINRNGQALLNVLLAPNRLNRSETQGAYNFVWNNKTEVPKLSQVLRLDFHPTTKDSIFLRLRRWYTDTKSFTPGASVGGGLPLVNAHYLFTDDSALLGYTRILSPSMVNEFTIAMRGVKEIGAPRTDTEFDAVNRAKVGFNLGQLYQGANRLNLIPFISFGGVPSAAGFNYDTRTPIDAGDQRVNLNNNFSLIHRNHSLKFGFAFEHLDTSEGPRSNASPSGNFDFGRNPNNPLDTDYAYSNALLGNFASYVEATNLNQDKARGNVFEWFAQDTWKLGRLTLNYGLRFSYFTPWLLSERTTGASFVRDRYDPTKAPALFRPALNSSGQRVAQNPLNGQLFPEVYIGAFVPGSGNPTNGMVVSTDSSYPDGFRDHRPLELGPRFGFAYDVSGKGNTVVRGGFASTKQTAASTQQYLWQTTQNPPVAFSPQVFYGNMDSLLSSTGVLFPSGVSSIQRDDQTATVYSYSLGIQHQLAANTVLDVSYVGNTARHLIQSVDINTLRPGVRFEPSSIDPTTGRALPDVFLRPISGYGGIGHTESSGTSNYNSLQVQVNRRFQKGLQIGGSYTWSKAMDLTSSDGGGLPYYLNQRSRLYGKAQFDETHIFVANYLWDLPKASQKWNNLFSRVVLDNWQLSGITTYASGLPQGINFSTTDNADITGGGDAGRVNMRANPILSRGQRSVDKWFNTDAFDRPGRGDFGNAPKDVFRGPGTSNWDISVIRKFPVTEQRYFQFRTEFYNAWNHTQFQFVDNNARFDPAGRQVNGQFGQVIANRPPRVIQFAVAFYF